MMVNNYIIIKQYATSNKVENNKNLSLTSDSLTCQSTSSSKRVYFKRHPNPSTHVGEKERLR